MRRPLLLLAPLFGVLGACERAPAPASAPEPIVVYATAGDETAFEDRLAGFTEETGIPVDVKYGDSAANTNLVISNQGSPHADVLLTTNVADIWRAADEGALLPIQSERLSSVAPMFRDPDRFWVADDVRLTVVAVNRDIVAGPGIERFADLAGAQRQGRLCLLSSGHDLSRSLMAMLIEEHGVRPAERIVRGWVRNLAQPPFESEQALLEAIRDGACGYGILSDTAAREATVVIPEPAYFDIDGLGVVRHSRYPQSAQALVDWMLSKRSPDPVSVNPRNIGVAGWRDNDAKLLAERAGYH